MWRLKAPAFGGAAPAARVASQLFLDSFDTALSTTTDKVNESMTAFTKLPAASGRIPLYPGVKRKVLAFVQWSRTMIRTDRDPTLMAFPVGQTQALLNNLQTCKRFEKQSNLLAVQSKPKDFKSDIQWIDWEPTLVKYLRQIPGCTEILLSYVVRRDAVPPTLPIAGRILDSYVERAPLVGDTFEVDTQNIHTLILTFLTQYPELKSIIRTATDDDGRTAYLILVSHFEGVGAMRVHIINAEKVIRE